MTITTPPAPGFKLVARRKFISDRVYPAGAEVPVTAAGRNFESLLRSGYLAWLPSNQPTVAVSGDLPTVPKAKKKPRVVILETTPPDPVESWKRTRAHMIKQCDGDAQLARDLLDSDERARDLYRLACRVGCEAEARRRGVQSIGPDQIGL
jgi:hypothetical protein